VADTSKATQTDMTRGRSTSPSAAKARGSSAAQIQSHYDLSNAFFRLWLDTNQVYSCAYFQRDDMTLEEAQIAKIDLALGKLGLEPGMTLLDIGCGWGAAMMRALEKYDVNVIGLTLSRNQKTHIERLFTQSDSPRSKEVRLQSWEQWQGQVDRVVSIGAFEHFGFTRYDDFFETVFRALPEDGTMLLHSIVVPSIEEFHERNLQITMSGVRFVKFIMDEIFPGGRLPLVAQVETHAAKAGFNVTRVQPLRPHYARTLDIWAANLQSKKDEAIAITSPEVYERYMKYLTGCADLFRDGYTDVCQFTCEKASLNNHRSHSRSGGQSHPGAATCPGRSARNARRGREVDQ
jgi:cyclopropane-fatty-acyl-phospholipid synthase